MNLLLAIIVSAVVISVVIIATIRKRLKVKSNELLEQIKGLISYSDRSNYEQAKERLSAFNKETFIDIPTDLNNAFCGKIITATQEKILSIITNHIFKKHIHSLRNLKLSISLYLKPFPNSSMILESSINL